MEVFINDLVAPANYEPILAALGVVAAFAIIFLAIKGKLRDWLLR